MGATLKFFVEVQPRLGEVLQDKRPEGRHRAAPAVRQPELLSGPAHQRSPEPKSVCSCPPELLLAGRGFVPSNRDFIIFPRPAHHRSRTLSSLTTHFPLPRTLKCSASAVSGDLKNKRRPLRRSINSQTRSQVSKHIHVCQAAVSSHSLSLNLITSSADTHPLTGH